MNYELVDIRGHALIGVFMFASNRIALISPDAYKLIPTIRRILEVEPVIVTIAGSGIIGVMVAGNDYGLLLPHIAREDEVRLIKQSFEGNVMIVKSRHTALGNICLANNRAALVHEDLYRDFKEAIKDALNVEVVAAGRIAGLSLVGSAAFVNNIGGLVHPDATDEDLKFLGDLFGVRFDVGTVNFGIGFIRSGLVGNDRGLLIGRRTTGPELLRIMKVFGGA